jgi:hypothetical protein
MAGEAPPTGIRRALRIEVTAGPFSRRLGRLTDDVSSSLLCGLRSAVLASGRRRAFEELQQEVGDLERGLRAYLSADIAAAAEAVFRGIERPLGAKLHAPITLADDPARMAIAQMFQSIGGDLQRTFHRADVERVQREIANLAEGSAGLGPIVRGTLLGPIARGVDAAELEIFSRVLVPTFVIELQRLLDAARDELVIWFRLVRSCLAVALLDGLPYAAIWGDAYKTACRRVQVGDRGIYGEAGYWLAMEVLKMAMDIELSPVWEQLMAVATGDSWLAEFASFSPSLAAPSQYPLVRKRNQLAFEPNQWRQRCSIVPCRIDQQGEQFPFEFPPVEQDVMNNPELVGQQDQMYARANAQTLIRFVRTLWDAYRDDVMEGMKVELGPEEEKEIQKPEKQREAARDRRRDLEFRVGAATLQHGGAHPPHRTHRNGAMFDVVVRGVLPLHCKGQPEMSDEDANAREAEWAGGALGRRSGGGTIPARAEGMPLVVPAQAPQSQSLFTEGPFGAADDPGQEVRSPCRQWEYPARTIKLKGGTIAIEKVGMRITQCILLSFPSQVILADWRTLRDATNDLIDRFEKLQATASEDDDTSAVTHMLKWLGAREPDEEPPPPWRGRLLLVPRHEDHWHVSYLPKDVEEPPEGRDAALHWIESHLDKILPD